MLDMGPNTIWLGVHGLSMIVVPIFSAFLFGSIYFSKTADERLIRRLKISSAVTFAALLLLMASGIVPDTAFSGAALTHTTTNDFGTFSAQVTDDNVGAFAGPLLFDVMEHVSLIVPGLAAVIGYLLWTHGAAVIEAPAMRRSVLSLMVLTGFWTLVLGMVGVFITKVLTFPMNV